LRNELAFSLDNSAAPFRGIPADRPSSISTPVSSSTQKPLTLVGSFRKLLCVPGIQYLATRFGSASLRRWSFDEKFRSGHWSFTSAPSSELVQVVERYAQGGHILMLGCGGGAIAGALRPDSFASFLGVDLSPEAVSRAGRHANHKVRFQVGDMLQFECEQKFDVILFSESLYYLRPRQRRPLLARVAQALTPSGQIVVTIAQPQRFADILRMIRRDFDVAEDRNLAGSPRHLLVFR
jgi:SAM-dependent methyltransferase